MHCKSTKPAASREALPRTSVPPLAVLSLAVLLAAGCASTPPAKPDDLCAVFDEKSGWKRAASKAGKRWGMSVPALMAVAHKESSFIHNARPPRKKVLGLFPGGRPSSAYGYAQATDEAWVDYQRATGHWRADRDDFGDAIDFVGWYLDRSHRQLNIPRNDVRHLYISYHEGVSGYRSGRWRKNTWLNGAADRVAATRARFSKQWASCGG